MKTLDAELLRELTSHSAETSLSIYLPLHKSVSESSLDFLAFKNLIKDIRSGADVTHHQALEDLLVPVENFLESKDFVRGSAGALAIFSAPKVFEIVMLPEQTEATFYIDECFYLLPLLAFAGDNKPFQVLALGKNHVRLFEGDRYRFDEINLDQNIPSNMKEALGYDLTDNHLHAAAGGSAAIHGYMEITDEKETDNTRFFRIIDQEINEKYSKQRKMPLILAALPENESLFQSISKNECLEKDCISLNADSIDKQVLHSRALEILDTKKTEGLDKQLERFAGAKSENLATDEVAEIARHAMDSRIERLFITKGKKLPGSISIADRKIKPDADSHSDIINKIALLTYKNGGQIHTLQTNTGKLPSGIGSINRF
ncbi:baeRF3 domain-containing protein [Sphingobacterium paludis]|uniref:Uncharacterized protein n=1 Tax=Sphingobacterium paludis TaxID=1476465 RepID=A0A4R7CYV9_9SPHI|nr:hypothetical protein [Sphingobacterium paludis]TDS13127.1 hypothetical protein B0I21_105261 [Sphingobacterium paludis]